MTSPNFSCINALFFFLWQPNLCLAKRWLWKKLPLEHSSLLYFCSRHKKEAKGESWIQSKVTTRSSKECCRSTQTKAAVCSFFPPRHSPVLYINHTFGIWITKVRGVWWTIMHHCFVDGIRGLVWENARWKARNTLLYLSHENQNKTQSLINSYKTVKGSGGMW